MNRTEAYCSWFVCRRGAVCQLIVVSWAWFGFFMVMTMMWQCHLSSSECRCYRLNGFSFFKRLPIPLSSGSRMLEQSVGEWLESIGLQQYESKLLLNGFDDVRFLVSNCVDIN